MSILLNNCIIYFIFTKIINYVRNQFYLKLLDILNRLCLFSISLFLSVTTQMLYARLCYTFAAIVNQKSAPTMRFSRIDTEGKHDIRLFILLSLRFDKFSSLQTETACTISVQSRAIRYRRNQREEKRSIMEQQTKTKALSIKKITQAPRKFCFILFLNKRKF